MNIRTIFDVVKSANVAAFRLAFRNSTLAREYIANSVQKYDELMGRGLPPQNPLAFMSAQGWVLRRPEQRVEIPAWVELSGGTRLDELLILATVTRVLAPSKVFEIGTFMGQTTSVFVLNAPPGATVITMDLPPDVEAEKIACGTNYIDTDLVLVNQRRVGSFLHAAGLSGRYQQTFCDSMDFDPSVHAGTVELGFIDGAHARQHVENDTRKMAVLIKDRGLVFWHDYGGKGRFRDLTEYLDRLAARAAIYRVPGTSLAWAPGSELRKAV